MNLKELTLPYNINTSESDPISELFIPALKSSTSYDVAVGYFSTSWIRDAAEGIASLVANGGHSRWVISPSLNEDDWAMLSKCENENQKIHQVEKVTINSIIKLQQELETHTRDTIAWLIRDGFIEFKIAIPKNRLRGIFHAKLGIFRDSDNNTVAFSGSYNLTSAANTNWETIEVFFDWMDSDNHRVKTKIKEFEKIWNEKDINLDIYKPTDPAIEKFVEITNHSPRPYKLRGRNETSKDQAVPQIPNYFLDNEGKLRAHQELAIKKWFEANGQGIFHMATGAGKTVTALATAVKMLQEFRKRQSKLIVVISVPYKHLAEQWATEAKAFGFRPITCYDDYTNWIGMVKNKLLDLQLSLDDCAFIITVNATLMRDKFQNILANINTNLMFIADEMHNLGGTILQQALPSKAKFRLGLSATPDRYLDLEGTNVLRGYFKDTLIEYGIKEAIRDGTLTKYFYYPVLVELNELEMAEYRELTNKIGKMYSRGKNDAESDSASILNSLLIKRARLVSNAEGKLPMLKSLLQSKGNSAYNLVYCGDSIDDNGKQVDKVVSLIGKDIGMRVSKFTSEEPNEERGCLLKSFGTGDIQTLVAIRCLDEGVDVPKTQTAYILASSSNPRQFVQRRGRVLRKAEGKQYAYIYDFVTIPPNYSGLDDGALKVEQQMMKKELLRVNEFAETAENSGDALSTLRDLKIKLNLMDM